MKRKVYTTLLLLFLGITILGLMGLSSSLDENGQVFVAIVLIISLTGASVFSFLLRRQIIKEQKSAARVPADKPASAQPTDRPDGPKGASR